MERIVVQICMLLKGSRCKRIRTALRDKGEHGDTSRAWLNTKEQMDYDKLTAIWRRASSLLASFDDVLAWGMHSTYTGAGQMHVHGNRYIKRTHTHTHTGGHTNMHAHIHTKQTTKKQAIRHWGRNIKSGKAGWSIGVVWWFHQTTTALTLKEIWERFLCYRTPHSR